MVQIETVRAATLSLVQSQPLVAAFIGGTSGIGEYTIRALADSYSNGDKALRVYIVGRNAKAGQLITADCLRICPKGQFIFVQAQDLALLRDVDRVCAEIIRREESEAVNGQNPRLDLLVMSQACSVFQKQKETKEGLDFLMSLMFYSRMRFIVQLVPLLLASSMPARVVSVYAAGTEDKLLIGDLPLRDPSHYGYFQARSHITFITTVLMEWLAEKYQGRLSLIHVFPGLVLTPAFGDPSLPLWFKILWCLSSPVTRFIALSPAEIGARILFLATFKFPARGARHSAGDSTDANATEMARGTDGIVGSGAYAVGDKSEVVPTSKAYQKIDKSELATASYKHIMHVFREIEAGKKFEGETDLTPLRYG